ncbi:histone H1-delta-like [Liolophura sinensis]|uniref:histone H1-delta-like n=1 Tax=Liolophura sinensis TaxID=3198878 RepID=UPI00315976CF
MADTAAAPVAKAKKASKPKKPADHPKYSEMVKAAISGLKERGGSSRQKILKYIVSNYKVGDEKSVNTHLKVALRNGVKSGLLKQSKGTGAAGSFRLGDSAKKAPAKPKKKAAAKKPAAKKSPAKKPKVKKAKSPKKAAKKPAAKKATKKAAPKKPKATKKPAAKKPKAKKSPKKAAKKPAKK